MALFILSIALVGCASAPSVHVRPPEDLSGLSGLYRVLFYQGPTEDERLAVLDQEGDSYELEPQGQWQQEAPMAPPDALNRAQALLGAQNKSLQVRTIKAPGGGPIAYELRQEREGMQVLPNLVEVSYRIDPSSGKVHLTISPLPLQPRAVER